MLESIRNKLVQYEPARDGRIQRKEYFLDLDVNFHCQARIVRGYQRVRQIIEIYGHVHPGKIA